MDQNVYGGSQIVSAAVLSGQLIIGLADGKVIDCGRVTGPQGLRGDRGPIGATGQDGKDGNTILTGQGPPRTDLGVDGDYFINNRDWFIFGPKANGYWGKGQGMLPKDIPAVTPGGTSAATGGGGAGGGGGVSGKVFTNNVILTAPTRLALDTKAYTNGVIKEPPPGMTNQQDVNRWFWGDAWPDLQRTVPVYTSASKPTDEWEGRLWFDSDAEELTLYVYYNGDWVPASPPVSLDGIEASIANVEAELLKVNANIAMNKRDIDEAMLDVQEDQTKQDERLGALETEAQDHASTTKDNTFTGNNEFTNIQTCLLYTSPSPRDRTRSRMPSSA